MTNQSVSQRLHENLGQIIAEAAPGERLPSEPALARNLGVSRATLREAMRTFETQGLIRRRQGSGTYVSHPSGVIDSGLEVVLDGQNCTWSRKCIGLPAVVRVRDRLAVLYDAPGGDSKSHMRRNVGLAWLDLPLTPPANQ